VSVLEDGLDAVRKILDGYVVDEERAKSSPCTCYRAEFTVDGERKVILICYSKGIIGVLTKDQILRYCPEKIIKKASDKMIRRFKKFIEAVKAAKGLPLRERLRKISEYLRSSNGEETPEVLVQYFPSEEEVE